MNSKPAVEESTTASVNYVGLDVVHSVASWLPLTENWLYDQVVHLPTDIRSTVMTISRANDDTFPFPRVICLADRGPHVVAYNRIRRRLGDGRTLPFARRAMMKVKPHVVHSHFGNRAWQDAAAVRDVRAKHVVSFYGLDVTYLPKQDPVWRDRYKELFTDVSQVLCEGPHMAGAIRALGASSSKVRVHHLGVRVNEIPFITRLRQPGEPIRVLMAGSFREKKGFPLGIRALARVAAKYPLKLTIIGDANNESRSIHEKERILDALSRANLPDVKLLGYQPRSRLIAEALAHQIFLAPSVTASDGDTEGGAPVTLLEMAATGMVIVSSTHCDIPHMVKSDSTGLLAREGDEDALVQKLLEAIESTHLWQSWGIAARQRVKEEFDSPTQATRLAEVYREVVGNG